MLQQTRVETVIPYFDRFLTRFPTPLALAEAPEDEVLAAWSGLGYYRRARMLHAGAKHVVNDSAMQMPKARDALLALPGVGRYTAGAIASIAYGEPVGLVDGNVARVFARILGIESDMRGAGMREAERLAETIVHRRDPGSWNQALMELGATVCTPKNPSCDACPVASVCVAHATGRVHVLPVLREKTKPKDQSMIALVATREADGFVLLARRKSEGLFGGLWEPPLFEGEGKPGHAELVKRFPPALFALDARPSARVTHVLSHRRMTIAVHRATTKRVDPSTLDLPEVYESAALFDLASLEKVGISTLARKVLAGASTAKATKKKKR